MCRRTQQERRAAPYGGPKPLPQRPRQRGQPPRPQQPAGGGAQDHIQPRPSLRGRQASGKKAQRARQKQQHIARRRGKARAVAQPAQHIIHETHRRAEQEESSRLQQLYGRRELHQ